MNKKDVLIMASVALVVAVIASLITANITGNTIRVQGSTAGSSGVVYTKAEIDYKLKNVTTNQGVLSMLKNNCILTNPALYSMSDTYPISQVCNKYNAQYGKTTTCVFADQWDGTMTRVLNCGLNLNKNNSGSVHVMCCSP